MLHIFNKVKREEKVPKNRFKSGKSILFVRDTMKKSFDLKLKNCLNLFYLLLLMFLLLKFIKE